MRKNYRCLTNIISKIELLENYDIFFGKKVILQD